MPRGFYARTTRSAETLFWRHVDKSGECWIWTAGVKKTGYGQFRTGDRLYRAHRWAYAHLIGPIPPGLYVCHRCDNPPCVRPDHLFLGTQRENLDDARRKGRWPRRIPGKAN